jgi:hypothetical protein
LEWDSDVFDPELFGGDPWGSVDTGSWNDTDLNNSWSGATNDPSWGEGTNGSWSD